jgi:hypothetical protein
MAERPDRPAAAQPIPVVDVQTVLERALNLLDWQELEGDDDRSDIQKLIDNATDSDTVLVRDPSGTPELQEIGILELLQRYPCRGSEPRWSPDNARLSGNRDPLAGCSAGELGCRWRGHRC